MDEVLKIGVTEKGGTCVLRLIGELDSYTSEYLASTSDPWMRVAQEVIVDLGGVEYIDSDGLSVLVGMWVRAMESGVRLTISRRNPRIQRVFEITGLLNLFDVDSSSPEARGLLASRYHGTAVSTGAEVGTLARAASSSGGSEPR